MITRSMICLLAGAVLAAQDSSHDAPLELMNNTVHALFRTDTLIDRQLAKTAFNMTDNQIFQHTHRFGHTLQISIPGMPYMMINISPSDQLHFRLSGNRGFVTVVPQDKPGIGGLVAGHAAEARGPVVRSPDVANPGELIRRGSNTVSSKLSKADQHSLHTVWVVQGPSGYTWAPQRGKTEQKISEEIATIAAYSNHQQARNAARQVEYLLQDNNGQSNFTMERLFVTSNGRLSGEGICLPDGTRIVVCENVYDPVAKKAVASCPPPPGNKL